MAAEEETEPTGMTFEEFRRSFYYGEHADMQFKYLARMADGDAADSIAALLGKLGEALDTGDLDGLRRVAFEAQVKAYSPPEPVQPEVDDAPFTPLPADLSDLRLALISAGGVYVVGDDPMGPDGPTQQECLPLIKDFLRGAPTLSRIPVDTPPEQLTARHPGYDAMTAQRDINTVFPLAHLRALESEGTVQLAGEHYAFTGATSHTRLRKEVAPQWAEHMAAREVDAAFLVAT
ncbi:MAG: glycine/betaine/sarcosine/D-proline family reductase selenoprotein B [Actinomycetota bacterium]|nr:glycine/betaine/sarcosine/D-proline family reductase selenoprotein B [Actinomycetota bacterium]